MAGESAKSMYFRSPACGEWQPQQMLSFTIQWTDFFFSSLSTPSWHWVQRVCFASLSAYGSWRVGEWQVEQSASTSLTSWPNGRSSFSRELECGSWQMRHFPDSIRIFPWVSWKIP